MSDFLGVCQVNSRWSVKIFDPEPPEAFARNLKALEKALAQEDYKYGVWFLRSRWEFERTRGKAPYPFVVGLFKAGVEKVLVVSKYGAVKLYARCDGGFRMESDYFRVSERAYPLKVRELVEASRRTFEPMALNPEPIDP